MNVFSRYLTITIMSFLFCGPVSADLFEQRDLNFNAGMLKLDLEYFFEVLPGPELRKKYRALSRLDSQKLLKKKNVEFVVSKAVYVVNKPAGLFDAEEMNGEKFLRHMLADQSFRKISANEVEVVIHGTGAHKYQVRSSYDSDDISTLPDSRISQAVAAAKELDVISRSASTIVFKEFYNYSKYAVGGSSLTSYISLSEKKTLVVSYQFLAVKKKYALPQVLKSNFLNETSALRNLINTYQ